MSKRILLLVHKQLVPPSTIETEPDRFDTPWITEYDVLMALKRKGYEVEVFGIINEVEELIEKIKEFKPQIVFNLLEEFDHDTRSDYKITALLEMLGIKYTGCNPRGLMLARDKALSKKILTHHRIGTPQFFTLSKKKKIRVPKSVSYPVIVKCLYEEASFGIAQSSVCHSKEKLIERVEYIHQKLDQDAIIEEFIPGQELYLGIIGNKKLHNLPLWELQFQKVDSPENEIYSSRAKWNKKYRERKGIDHGAAKLTTALEEKVIKACKKTYQLLELSGYARIDLRLTPEGKIYILEANPNPNIAEDDEFAKSAEHEGLKYDELIERLLPS